MKRLSCVVMRLFIIILVATSNFLIHGIHGRAIAQEQVIKPGVSLRMMTGVGVREDPIYADSRKIWPSRQIKVCWENQFVARWQERA